MGWRCRIELLGGFRATVDDRPIPPDAWHRRRGADLVKLLALTPDHRLHREQLLEALWPDLPPGAGSANLRKALHFARRALGSDDAIVVEGELLSLWPSAEVTTDLAVFEDAAREALRSGSAERCSAAADLATVDLLPGELPR